MQPTFDGPIPGENFTSDTRNYPWHRAPDLVDHDEAIEYVVDQMAKPEAMSAIMTLLEAGANIAGIVSTFNMVNISDGKYPIDLSILIAGPLARYLEIVAKQNGIEADMGLEEDDLMTLTRAKALAGIIDGDDDTDIDSEAEISPNEAMSGGLMAPPTETDMEPADMASQEAMMGYGNEEGELA